MIEDFRNEFKKELEEKSEAICPCCERRARINRLRVHSTLALMLSRLYYMAKREFNDPQAWMHIESFKPKHRTGNDFSIVKHWGLAESRRAGEGEDKISSGMWRLTPDGVNFVEGHTFIDKYACVLDDRVISYGGGMVSMEDALNGKFSYAELRGHLGTNVVSVA